MAEGAPLLREYRVKSSIEGSNPSHSASYKKVRRSNDRRTFFFFPYGNLKLYRGLLCNALAHRGRIPGTCRGLRSEGLGLVMRWWLPGGFPLGGGLSAVSGCASAWMKFEYDRVDKVVAGSAPSARSQGPGPGGWAGL